MEEYEDIECDAFDAPDAPDATTTSGEQENGLNRQMIRQLGRGMEGKLVGNSGVLKATSGKAAKRLKMRQGMRATTRAGKAAEAAAKQLANKELQIEKARMEEWKQTVMTEVAHELQGIKHAHEEAMGIQRQGFQLELEKVKEKLEMVESRAVVLEKGVQLLKSRKPTLEKELAQSAHANTNRQKQSSDGPVEGSDRRPSSSSPAASNPSTIPSSSKVISGIKSTKPAPKSYAQIAASNITQSALDNSWTEVTSNNRKRKGNAASPPKVEPEKRRLIFRKQANSPQKSEADLMLVLNESLQKAGIPAYVRFGRVSYSQSSAISELLTERSNAEDLIKHHLNTLIRAAKLIDKGVIRVEALERWHRLKVHGMPLMRYLGEGRMEVLSREIESFTGIKLKTTPRWLISKAQLEERLDIGTGRGSAIVITVTSEEDVSKLCTKGLRFGGAPKVVEKYWEAGPSSVCITCSGIGHDRLRGCNQRFEQCVIFAGAYKTKNHKCEVTECIVKKGKICVHVVPKCANCGGNHQATAFRCPARQKAQAIAWKNKGKKAQDREEKENSAERNREASVKTYKERESTPKPVEMELNTNNNWAQSPIDSSNLSFVEDSAPRNTQDPW